MAAADWEKLFGNCRIIFMKDGHADGMAADGEEQAAKNAFLAGLLFNGGMTSKMESFMKR